MWIGYDEQKSNRNIVFLIMGKALRLCQNLEMNINHIVSIIRLEEGIKSGAINKIFDENWNKIVLEMKKYFLNASIKQMNKFRMFTTETIEKLEKGRISRNEIVHNSAMILSGSIHKGKLLKEELEKYFNELTNVAIADNIVSGLDWTINEKEPPCKSEKQYIKDIKNWINNI